jgi:hypothetical protein
MRSGPGLEERGATFTLGADGHFQCDNARDFGKLAPVGSVWGLVS